MFRNLTHYSSQLVTHSAWGATFKLLNPSLSALKTPGSWSDGKSLGEGTCIVRADSQDSGYLGFGSDVALLLELSHID